MSIYRRTAAVFFLFIMIFSVEVAWLFKLTNDGAGVARAAAQRQQEYLFTVSSIRGTIYDHSLTPLTNTGAGYAAVVEPERVADRTYVQNTLIRLSDLGAEEIVAAFRKGKPFSVKLSEPVDEADGFKVIETVTRFGSGYIANHIIGYLDHKGEKGQSGIEKAYDDYLASAGGEIYASITVDAAGRRIDGLPLSIFHSGYERSAGVVLTLDDGIQRVAEIIADQYALKGAIVVADVKTGAIRAMVSRPDFDPGNIAAYLESSEGEFVNRALSSYNAGSIFKLVVAAAAIEHYGGEPTFKYDCVGYTEIAGRKIACHSVYGHGVLGFSDAIAKSCNPYFIRLGLRIGLFEIIDMAKRMGIGGSISFAPGITSSGGALPLRDVTAGELTIANTSIGQGAVMMTPVEMASVVQCIANGGVMAPLYLVEGYVDDEGAITREDGMGPGERRRVLDEDVAAIIKNAMIATCKTGTGRAAAPDSGGAGGKTASAETGMKIQGEMVIHGTFVGFFPAEDPEYAVCILVENGRSGSSSAAPAFKGIADYINGAASDRE